MSGETVLVIDDSPTILKVVELVLTKSDYKVVTAADGDAGIAAARACRPDLILLDFVMPKLNGYQVCRALHDLEQLNGVPVVLMSAKGDQVGERFVKVMGIVDYITKPFSPEAITALVGHTIRKYADHPLEEEQGVSPEEAIRAADAIREAERAAFQRLREGIGQIAADAALSGLAESSHADASATSTLSRDGGSAGGPNGVAGAAELAAIDREQLTARIAAALTDDRLDVLLSRLRSAAPQLAGASDAVLAGDLRVVPLAEVLLLLGEQEQLGTLTVTRCRVERDRVASSVPPAQADLAGGEADRGGPESLWSKIDLYFRAGRVELAAAVGVSEEFLLGRFIVDKNLMSRDELELFLSSRAGSSKLLGNKLVKLGYISDSELREAMREQARELVYEAMRWTFGRFAFRATREVAPIAAEAALGLQVQGILMEGLRRVDEWHLIEREVDDFNQVFLRNEDALSRLGRGKLTREELAILELTNGKNSVKEIARQSRMGSFEVSKLLYRLLSVKLIRKRVQPVAV